ncbi:MAG: shikimate kinase [Lachnospiraceae bacterium]
MENIILIGYMGSGKTTVGKIAAERKNYTFVDTDEMIVEQQHRSISEIFAADGERAFRDMETALLGQLIAEKREHLVISTGGGMPLRTENQQLLARLGKVVYLKASPVTIYNRIKGDTTRPLLQCENPLERIEEMIVERSPLYEAGAMFIVEVDELSQSEAASEILTKCSG